MTSDPSPRPFSWSARGQSFRHAVRGLRVLVATEHNARLHAAASIAVIACGLLLHISRIEWMAVTLAIGLVMATEAVNTAVERLGDGISGERDPLVKDAKDLAAAGVLAAATAAAIVGLLVFVPRLFTLFVSWGGAA